MNWRSSHHRHKGQRPAATAKWSRFSWSSSDGSRPIRAIQRCPTSWTRPIPLADQSEQSSTRKTFRMTRNGLHQWQRGQKKKTNKQTNKNQTKPNIKRVANPSKTGHVTQSFLMTSEAGDGAIFLELEPLFFLSIFLSLSARVERLRTKPTIKPTSWPSGGALPTGRHFVSRAALLLFLFSRPLFPNFCDIFSLSLSLCVCVCVRV